MTDEKLNVEAADGRAPSRKRGRKWAVLGAVVVVLVAVGAGMAAWHGSPSFCSSVCHIEDAYVENFAQEQDAPGVDKFGNAVSNTNAMMAVLHRSTKATAKPEIVCVDCHVPNFAELTHDGLNYLSGNYIMPREERSLSRLMSWGGKEGPSFCANGSCHVYLLGDDGLLDWAKLEKSTAGRAFNFHAQQHGNLSLECSDCHKGHRASTVVCTGCHEHADVELPAGWVTFGESQELLREGYGSRV